MPKDLLFIDEAAVVLGISVVHTYFLIRRGRLVPPDRYGKKLTLSKRHILDYMASRMTGKIPPHWLTTPVIREKRSAVK